MTTTGLSPQETVERALAAARSGDCVVIAEETSDANLRWAGNTLTTNGVTRSRQLTVIAIDRRAGGAAAGVVSRSGVLPGQIEEVVREAEQAAAEATPAEDEAQLPGPDRAAASGSADDGWADPPRRTGIGVLREFAGALGETLREAAGVGRQLYGFAEHEMTSTFLGTSAGVRLRHDQPAGRIELNAKSADLTRSAWTGAGTRALGGPSGRCHCPRAGTRPCCHPPPYRTCSSTCTGRRARRTPRTGGRCSARQAAAPGSASSCPRCRSRCPATRGRPGSAVLRS
jgi:predicted Zn-dependent protease